VLFWCIGWILSIVSIVFGIIALNKVKNGTGKGKVMAIVGIVFAALTFVVWAVLLVAIRHSGTLTPK
jgi:ABC-type transport system involved in multi-copper enzyme maturation permease subunit